MMENVPLLLLFLVAAGFVASSSEGSDSRQRLDDMTVGSKQPERTDIHEYYTWNSRAMTHSINLAARAPAGPDRLQF